MAYDEVLTDRMRTAIGTNSGVSEKRMMGGICFFLRGNMMCGADRSKLGERRFMFRVGKKIDPADRLPEGEPMLLGGRPMPGFYFVPAERCDDQLLVNWLEDAMAHAGSLPPK